MDTLIKKTIKEKRILNGYILAFLLLLLSYLLTFYTNRQLSNQIKSIDRTNTIINNLEKMLSVVKDAETGVRGYIITKRLDFLSPYQGSRDKTDSLHNLIALLTGDNPLQHEKVMRLKEDIDRRFKILNFVVADFDSHNREITDTLKKLQSEVKNVMDNIRTSVSTLQQNENASLIEREEKIQTTINTMNIIVITSLVLAIALVIFGVITFFKQNNERKKGLLRIKNYQIELDNRIKELNKANEELIQMRSIEKFAATGRIARTIAHEVRNPLTNINLAADQLKAEITPDDENARFLFDMIHRNSNRINLLISDLLNSTKFSDLNYEKVSINKLGVLKRTLVERKKLITNYNSEIQLLDKKITELTTEKTDLEKQLERLKLNYKELIQKTQTNRSSYSKLMFILSAQSFDQTVRRVRYLQEFTDFQKQH